MTAGEEEGSVGPLMVYVNTRLISNSRHVEIPVSNTSQPEAEEAAPASHDCIALHRLRTGGHHVTAQGVMHAHRGLSTSSTNLEREASKVELRWTLVGAGPLSAV